MVPRQESLSFESDQVIPRELAADPQYLRDLRRGTFLEATQGRLDPDTGGPIAPVLPEHSVPLPLNLVSRDVVAGSAPPLLCVDESVSDQDTEMMMRRADAHVDGARD